MAVRQPLYYVSNNLREMSSSMVDEIVDQVVYQYSLDPSVVLSVVGSGGNLGTITDTRKQAGAYSTSTTAYPSEATTAEPSTVTVNYNKIQKTYASVSTPGPVSGRTLPLYVTGSNLKIFPDDDFYDTFIEPAIVNLISASTSTTQGG